MNNRHLYKAKRVDNGEWVEGYLYRISEQLNPFIMLKNRHAESHEVDPSTLCQCTGIEDKNDKLIWENSKCSVGRPCIYAVGHIKYLSGCFCFVEDGTRHILRLCDIKPNGYEIKVESGNPELLEVGE